MTIRHELSISCDIYPRFDLLFVHTNPGANVNTFDKQRNTSLHVAASAGHLDIVKLLLQKGARINALNTERATALHRASAYNRQQVVEFLLKR